MEPPKRIPDREPEDLEPDQDPGRDPPWSPWPREEEDPGYEPDEEKEVAGTITGYLIFVLVLILVTLALGWEDKERVVIFLAGCLVGGGAVRYLWWKESRAGKEPDPGPDDSQEDGRSG